MKTLPRLLMIIVVASCSAIVLGAQGTAVRPAVDAALAAKTEVPPPAMQQLEERIARLESELDALKKSGVKAGHPVAHVSRVSRSGTKTDSAEAVQLQINRLWDQIDLVMRKLDELADRR
jgi:hypothetical protein